MKKTMIAGLLGILLIGALGAVVVSAVASNNTTANAVISAVTSNNTKTNDDLKQMHKYCGKYMNSGTIHSGSMHNLCGKYMNSGILNSNDLNSNNSNESVGQTYTDSGSSNGGHFCH